MVITYNPKDMTGFANHMMEQIRLGLKKPQPDGKYHVSEADFINWRNEKLNC